MTTGARVSRLKTPSVPSWLNQVQSTAFFGLLATLVWAPLPLGSNRSWALALLAIVLCGLLLIVVASAFVAGVPLIEEQGGVRSGALWWPVGALAVFAGLVAIQLLPLPAGLLKSLAPGGSATGVVSLDPFNTRQYLLTCLACLAGFALVALLARSEQRLRWLLAVVVASGVLQAVIAITLFGGRSDYRLLFMSFSPGGRVTGSFANADHLAGYMELCLSAGIGLMLASMGVGKRAGRGWRESTVALMQFAMSRKMLVRLLLVLMVIALVMTHSRMGNAAFFVSLLITGCLCAALSRALRRPALWLVLSLVVVDVWVVGQWVGLDRVVQRIEATSAERAAAPEDGTASPQPREESLEERLQAARYALAMVPARPWLGYGGATFYTAFTPFKGTHPLGFYDHAHNDYVEIAADTGLVGLALLGALLLMALWRAVRAIGNEQFAQARGIGAAVFMAASCLAIHSLVDFNLQIPANSLTFTVILALAWCVPMSPSRHNTRQSIRQRRSER